MDRFSATITSILSTFLLVAMLALGGCAGGNVAGPQPDQPTDETITQSETPGDMTTNGEGTDKPAGHNTTPED